MSMRNRSITVNQIALQTNHPPPSNVSGAAAYTCKSSITISVLKYSKYSTPARFHSRANSSLGPFLPDPWVLRFSVVQPAGRVRAEIGGGWQNIRVEELRASERMYACGGGGEDAACRTSMIPQKCEHEYHSTFNVQRQRPSHPITITIVLCTRPEHQPAPRTPGRWRGG